METNNNNLNQEQNEINSKSDPAEVTSEAFKTQPSDNEDNAEVSDAAAPEANEPAVKQADHGARATPYFNNTVSGELSRIQTESKYTSWKYDDQNASDMKKTKNEGKQNAKIFAAVMACVFSGAIIVLILAVAFGGSLYRPEKIVYKDRVVYVREDGTVSGKLSIPEVYNKVLPSTVEVNVSRSASSGTGTGIIMSGDGYIITNAHVVEEAKTISVKLYDETEFDAELCGLDILADLAVIKIKPGSYELVPATFGRSSDLLVGEAVVAIGCPAGHFLTATNGIVSAPIKAIEINAAEGYVEKEMLVLQTSAQLNPGNSGGPLINLDGEVIGINTMKLTNASDGTPYEGLGYAIPIDEAMVLIEKLKNGEQTQGEGLATKTMRLGITGGICTKGEDDGTGGKFAESGVFVTEVQNGTNADGYLEAGDIIISFNGIRITDFDPFSEHIKSLKDKDVLSLEVYRDGKTVKVDIPMSILK